MTTYLWLNVGFGVLLMLLGVGAGLRSYVSRRRVHPWYSYAVVLADNSAYAFDEKRGRPKRGWVVIRRGLAQGQAYHLESLLNTALKVADREQETNDYGLTSAKHSFTRR